MAIVDPTPAINAVERGASLKIIGGTVPIAAYTLVGCGKYKTIKELKGTTIGVVSLVSGSTIFLRQMLKKEGLELNRDYSIIQGGPTTQRLASLKGCITSATMVLGGDLPRARLCLDALLREIPGHLQTHPRSPKGARALHPHPRRWVLTPPALPGGVALLHWCGAMQRKASARPADPTRPGPPLSTRR